MQIWLLREINRSHLNAPLFALSDVLIAKFVLGDSFQCYFFMHAFIILPIKPTIKSTDWSIKEMKNKYLFSLSSRFLKEKVKHEIKSLFPLSSKKLKIEK